MKKKSNIIDVDKALHKMLCDDGEEDAYPHITWEQLGKLIRKMPNKHKKQTVEVNDGGHDVFGKCLKHDRQGNPYIEGY